MPFVPESSLTSADAELLVAQLGREPIDVVAVAARCPAGHPSVVVSYPLRETRDGLEPFPTLWWLTCPTISRRLAQLERAGVIREAEAAVSVSPDMRAELATNHRSCIDQRWALLSAADRRRAVDAGLDNVLRQRGLGGQANFLAVKCLHMHFAQHLVEGNAVGAWVEKRYDVQPCAETPSRDR